MVRGFLRVCNWWKLQIASWGSTSLDRVYVWFKAVWHGMGQALIINVTSCMAVVSDTFKCFHSQKNLIVEIQQVLVGFMRSWTQFAAGLWWRKRWWLMILHLSLEFTHVCCFFLFLFIVWLFLLFFFLIHNLLIFSLHQQLISIHLIFL